jgi:hypothetical protein
MKKVSFDTWIQLLGMAGVLGGLLFKAMKLLISTFFTLLLIGCSTGSYGQGWTRPQKDVITDYQPLYATLYDYKVDTFLDQRISIRVGCNPEGPFVAFSYNSDTQPAIYRVETQTPVEVLANELQLSIIMGQQARELLGNIMAGRSLIIRIMNYSALSESTHYFQTSQNISLVSEVLQPCI